MTIILNPSNGRAAKAELSRLGITYDDVAAEMTPPVTRAAIGHYLSGRRRPSCGFVEALERLAGPGGARRVLRCIPPTEEEPSCH